MGTLEFIRHWEGCRLKAYQDQGGVWTVGYGCTGPGITKGTVWSQDKADQELVSRVERIQHILAVMVDVPLTPDQLTALTSFCYNVGLANFENSTLRRLLNAGDYQGAAGEFERWDHIHGVVNQGLLNRRLAERDLFATGLLRQTG